VIISLELGSPRTSSDLPEDFGRASLTVLLFGLAPGDACRAICVATDAVGSYPTVSPLPEPPAKHATLSAIGGLFSVAPVSDRSAWGLPSALPSGVRTFLSEKPPSDHPVVSCAPSLL
jgi:hypothetical protein